MKYFILLLLFIIFTKSLRSQQLNYPNNSGWYLVFEEEFNGTNGMVDDTFKWLNGPLFGSLMNAIPPFNRPKDEIRYHEFVAASTKNNSICSTGIVTNTGNQIGSIGKITALRSPFNS